MESSETENIADAANAREQMLIATQADEEKNLSQALSAYRKVLRRFPQSDQAPEAAFRIGELEEQRGDFQRAFKAYQTYVENYPSGTRFSAAIENQFKIATLYLEGERQRLLGIPTLPSLDKARSMFEDIITAAPYTDFAPLAQFNIGLTHERQKNLTAAILAYQTVLDRYPNSDVADDAQYQIAYVWYHQARYGSYDRTTADKAREAFEDFLIRFPDSEKVPQAEENLKVLTTAHTTNALEVAKFYDKQKKYKAAVIYYNEVIRQNPDSEGADTARTRIDELRSLVGDDALMAGPERAESGETARIRRRLQSQIDTAARPDFVGPPIPEVEPDELPPAEPAFRVSPDDIAPLPPPVTPDLPEDSSLFPPETTSDTTPDTTSSPSE